MDLHRGCLGPSASPDPRVPRVHKVSAQHHPEAWGITRLLWASFLSPSGGERTHPVPPLSQQATTPAT